MVTFQPDIVQNQLLTRVAELQLLIARNQLLPVLNFNSLYQFNGLGHHLDQAESVHDGPDDRRHQPAAPDPAAQRRPEPVAVAAQRLPDLAGGPHVPDATWAIADPLANNRQAQYTAPAADGPSSSRSFTRRPTQLARFFLEVDSNYKLFKTAGRLKAAAKQRLDAQAAFYENGTITIDRYLDAVNRWATAVAQEADFRTRYNTSIAALEEAKGTLLAYDNIALAEGPWPAKAYDQARDQQAGPPPAPDRRLRPLPAQAHEQPRRSSTRSTRWRLPTSATRPAPASPRPPAPSARRPRRSPRRSRPETWASSPATRPPPGSRT